VRERITHKKESICFFLVTKFKILSIKLGALRSMLEVSMALKQKVELRYLTSMKNGMTELFTPQSSNETILVQVAAGAMDNLFVTHSNQLCVLDKMGA
jgi:hypothetical protein